MREPLSYGIARSAGIALDPGLEWSEGRLALPHRELAEHRAAQRERPLPVAAGRSGGRQR